MTRQTTISLAVVGGLLVAGLLTYRSTLDHRSCVGCRGFSFVLKRSVFGMQFWHSERLRLAAGVPAAGHVHEWWRYSFHTSTAIGTTFACSSHRFADKTDY